MSVDFDIGYLPRQPVRNVVEDAVRAEELGFDGIWIADSQSVFREVFTCLSACAVRTEHLLLATGVSNPITRHPTVLASSMASLEELSDGRAVFGIGRGESAVQTIGRSPASLDDTESVIKSLRKLFHGETARVDDTEVKLPWADHDVPIHLASSGPKSLRLAGRVADGVLFQVGVRPELIEYALNNIRTGARSSGRSLEDIELSIRLGCNVRTNRDEAREAMKPYASVAAKTILHSVPSSEIPEELEEELKDMREKYDYYEHASEEAEHRDLVTEKILDSVSVAGEPDEVIERLKTVLEFDIDRVVIPLSDVEPTRFMELFSREIMPEVDNG